MPSCLAIELPVWSFFISAFLARSCSLVRFRGRVPSACSTTPLSGGGVAGATSVSSCLCGTRAASPAGLSASALSLPRADAAGLSCTGVVDLSRLQSRRGGVDGGGLAQLGLVLGCFCGLGVSSSTQSSGKASANRRNLEGAHSAFWLRPVESLRAGSISGFRKVRNLAASRNRPV